MDCLCVSVGGLWGRGGVVSMCLCVCCVCTHAHHIHAHEWILELVLISSEQRVA